MRSGLAEVRLDRWYGMHSFLIVVVSPSAGYDVGVVVSFCVPDLETDDPKADSKRIPFGGPQRAGVVRYDART